MKINCHVDASIDEEHADIWIRQMTPTINHLIQQLNNDQKVLWCSLNQQIIPVNFEEIFAIQTAARGLKISTLSKKYHYNSKISLIKEELSDDFIEASRSAIFNIKHIDHLELLDNGSIDVILKNKQRIQMARRKIKNLKEKLGI